MLTYILFNTLIYGTIAFILASWYAYGKFLNITTASRMVMGSYLIVDMIKHGLGWKNICFLILTLLMYRIIHRIVLKAFTDERQRDLFGLIFTLGGSLLSDNVTSLVFGPNPVTIHLRQRSAGRLAMILILINLLIIYVFHLSYLGKIRKAIAAQANTVRALGVRVDRLLSVLMCCFLPVLMMLGLIIVNESALKPTDNLFYLIKGIGIMILVGIEKKEYIYLGTLLYVCLEYLLFIHWSLPIGYKEALILLVILLVLIFKPTGLFSFRSRTI